MKDLSFDTGMVELAIQGDQNRILRFNPSDGNIIEGFLNLVGKANARLKDFSKEEEKIIQSNLPDLEKAQGKNRLNLEIDTFFRSELDEIFGVGTSELVFKDLCTSAITQNGECIFSNFLYAILPCFEKEINARSKTVSKIIQENRL